MIPEIEVLVEAYQEFYRAERPCGCTEEHRYPYNIDERGMPAVCLAHEWDRQQRLLQNALVKASLSLPIPPKVKERKQAMEAIEQAGERIYTNPAESPARIVMRKLGDDGAVATNLAWYLAQVEWGDGTARRQHIVCSLDRTTVITNTFGGQETEMRDALTYAPILVFWDNRDNRNGSWIKNAIRSRPHGLAFVIK